MGKKRLHRWSNVNIGHVAVGAIAAMPAVWVSASTPEGGNPYLHSRFAQPASEPFRILFEPAPSSGRQVEARATGFSALISSSRLLLELPLEAATTPDRSVPVQKSPRFETRAVNLVGARDDAELFFPSEPVAYQHHYSSGRSSSLPRYDKAGFRNIYAGIDVLYYSSGGKLEYDFVVAPGGDPSRIALDFSAFGEIELDRQGNLVLGVGTASIVHGRVIAYQEPANGVRRMVLADYVPNGVAGQYSIRLGKFDKSLPLIIDPVITRYSTFNSPGGMNNGFTSAVATDSSGNAYVVGAYSILGVARQAYVQKIGGSGDLLYSASIGASGANTVATAVAVDPSGRAYVAGYTNDAQLGGVPRGGHDAFVATLSANGAVSQFTRMGGRGSDAAFGIAIDASGRAYVTGLTNSTDFLACEKSRTCSVASSGSGDAFLTVIGSSETPVFETRLGASGTADYGLGIALSPRGDVIVVGQSINLRSYDSDAFVTRLVASSRGGFEISKSITLGGSGGDTAYGVAIANDGTVHVVGQTLSANFPAINAYGGSGDGFFVSYSPELNILNGPFHVGGSGTDTINAISLDSAGQVYVAGRTNSHEYAWKNYFGSVGQGADAFYGRLNANNGNFAYSARLGSSGNDSGSGIAVLGSGEVVVVGQTSASSFPLLNAYDTRYAGYQEGFAARLAEAYRVNLGSYGTGTGSVSSLPYGIDCGNSCDAVFKLGENVVLTATPQAGNSFKAWGGACKGSDPICTLSGLSEDLSVTAEFVAASAPGIPIIERIVSGHGKLVIYFHSGSPSGGTAVSYTLRCTPGSGGAVTSVVAGTSPITIYGLNNGVAYLCTLEASNSLGSSGQTAAVTQVVGARRGITPILQFLLD